jgi:hypothetical protein
VGQAFLPAAAFQAAQRVEYALACFRIFLLHRRTSSPSVNAGIQMACFA